MLAFQCHWNQQHRWWLECLENNISNMACRRNPGRTISFLHWPDKAYLTINREINQNLSRNAIYTSLTCIQIEGTKSWQSIYSSFNKQQKWNFFRVKMNHMLFLVITFRSYNRSYLVDSNRKDLLWALLFDFIVNLEWNEIPSTPMHYFLHLFILSYILYWVLFLSFKT